VDVSSLFVANAQAAKLVQPGKAPFHDPSPSTEATAVLCVAHRKQREDAPVAQTLPD